MDGSHLQTTGLLIDTQLNNSQIKKADSNLPGLILPCAFGTSLVVIGIFIILAATQVLPNGVNVVSSCGTRGYISGYIISGSGIITVVIGLVLHFRHKPKEDVSDLTAEFAPLDNSPIVQKTKKIGTLAFGQFCSYRQGQDKAYAHSKKASFFYYDCDDVKDYGWGCAWRCIQICASALNLSPQFKELYEEYRIDANSPNEWAEPGYGKRYLDDEGIPNQLVLYNKESGTSKTPTNWCEKIKGFPVLRDKLITHFNQYATPVMADDVTYAMTILGIRVTESDETILFIADPHKITYKSGLYYVVLDNEGNQIATTGVDNGKNGLNTVKGAHFNKGWMLLFPQPNR